MNSAKRCLSKSTSIQNANSSLPLIIGEQEKPPCIAARGPIAVC